MGNTNNNAWDTVFTLELLGHIRPRKQCKMVLSDLSSIFAKKWIKQEMHEYIFFIFYIRLSKSIAKRHTKFQVKIRISSFSVCKGLTMHARVSIKAVHTKRRTDITPSHASVACWTVLSRSHWQDLQNWLTWKRGHEPLLRMNQIRLVTWLR